MVLIAAMNAARASNLMNLTMEEVGSAEPLQEYELDGEPPFVIRNENYKTSLIYGEKTIVFSPIMWRDLENYIKFCRPVFF